MCTHRDSRGRKFKFRVPTCVEVNVVPSGNNTVIGDVDGFTSSKHDESESRQKVAVAPESEMTKVVEEGVLRESVSKLTSVELLINNDD